MSVRQPPVIPGFPHLLHGGDWNPDQWLDRPAIIDEDFRLQGLAGVNAVSLGIFAWSALEPEEGRYEFAWLDAIMDRLAAAGRKALLATPSGSKPAWLSLRHPEVCRVRNGRREPHGHRHNHCFTSPVYRAKVQAINARLAGRYARHPALGAWHLSNEYSGDCECDLCWAAFRDWLRVRHGDLAGVNRAWYTGFWGHAFASWEEIAHVDTSMHAMVLDWKRFVSDQTSDFIRCELEPLRRLSPGVPATTNLMGAFPGLDYFRIARQLDVVSWDSYPSWHRGDRSDVEVAAETAFMHDLMRGTGGGRPFLLMESTPSNVNWQGLSRPKRPGMHRVASLQAVAHGADSVMYFQWRKSRGSSEKFHGAVVDHAGHENTRVFREVAELGATLARLDPVVGLPVEPVAAVVFDWENLWALGEAQMPRNQFGDRWKDYGPTCIEHHRPLWRRGIATDVIDQTCDLSRYRLVVAPMLHLLRPGMAERLHAFVAAGGVLVTTYLAGCVDHNDQCFLGGFPGPLRPLLGLWAEETDVLSDGHPQNVVTTAAGTAAGLAGSYAVRHICDLVHSEGAEVLATYGGDWYAGRPAVTCNRVGRGEAWYVAARGERRLVDDVVGGIAERLGLPKAVDADLPEGVFAQRRGSGAEQALFISNLTGVACTVVVGPGWRAAEGGRALDRVELDGWDAQVLLASTG